MPFRNKKAFTLIEIVITLAIILIVVSAATPYFKGVLRDMKVKKMMMDMQTIKKNMQEFRLKYGRWPDTVEELRGEFLQELPKNPAGYNYLIQVDQYNVGTPTEGTGVYVVSTGEVEFSYELLVGPR